MKYQGTVSCRLKNRRVYLRRDIDAGGNEYNCITTKRLQPDRTIYKQHIHLSDEALVAIVKLRGYWDKVDADMQGKVPE